MQVLLPLLQLRINSRPLNKGESEDCRRLCYAMLCMCTTTAKPVSLLPLHGSTVRPVAQGGKMKWS